MKYNGQSIENKSLAYTSHIRGGWLIFFLLKPLHD